MEENTSNNKRILLVTGGGVVAGLLILGTVYKVVPESDEKLSIESTATSSEVVSIFDVDPIAPQAKVSTERWKTCRNEEYGYEFQFPGEWYIYGRDALIKSDAGKTSLVFTRTSEECNGVRVVLSPDTIGDIPRYIEPARSIGVDRPESRYSHEDMRSLTKQATQRGVEQYPFLLDGHDALLQIHEDNGKTVWSITSWFGGAVYSMVLPQYEEDIEIAETIFSTFRFLDATSTTTVTTPE